MKKRGVFAISMLIIAAMVLPPSAIAAPKVKPTFTAGSMTLQQSWPAGEQAGLVNAGEDVSTYTFHYVWTATGSDGISQAKGKLTLTVSHVLEDGTLVIDAVRTSPVTQLDRVSSNTVDLWTGLGFNYGPGDPAHASSVFRVIDNGKTGDELLTYCFVCSYPPPAEVFHPLSQTGTVKVR